MPISKATAGSIAPAAKGDLVVGSATNDAGVLAVGTNNFVLTADSAETLGVKWAAASTGALTKISRVEFSNVASQSFDGVFTSTYTAYMVVVEQINGSIGANLQFQFQHSTNTVVSTGYYNCYYRLNSSAAENLSGANNGSEVILVPGIYSGTTDVSCGSFTVTPAGNASRTGVIFGNGFSNNNTAFFSVGALSTSAQTYTGFKLAGSTGNITGAVAIYGLAE